MGEWKKYNKYRVKGQGTLYALYDDATTTKPQKYKLIKNIVNPVTGKRTKMEVTATTQSGCFSAMARKENLNKRQNGAVGDMSLLSVEQLCTLNNNRRYEQNMIKETTYDRNTVTIQNQIANSAIGNKPMRTLNSGDLDDFFAELFCEGRLSVSSINKTMYILNQTLKWLVARGELESNPMDAIREDLQNKLSQLDQKNKSDEKIVTLSKDEQKTFVNVSRTVDKNGQYKYAGALHGELLLYTGMRIGEYLALRWGDVDFNNSILKINKTRVKVENKNKDKNELSYLPKEQDPKSHSRIIILNEDALRILKELYDRAINHNEDDYICLTANGANQTADNMGKRLNIIYRDANLRPDIRACHVLRHTFATNQIRAGVNVKDVAAYIGDDWSTVMKYYVSGQRIINVDGKDIAVAKCTEINIMEDV